MDSFELNKVLGAVLGTCLVLLSLNIAANAIFAPHKPAKPGYDIAVQEATPRKPGAPAEPAVPIAELLAKADVGRGEASAKKCVACHNFGKGETATKPGPNLYGVVGRAKAATNFNYSAAMKAKGGTWTIDELDAFIQNPKAAVPGTNMTFAGIPRATERADLLIYMNSKSDNPAPLPKAADAGTSQQAIVTQR